MADAFEEEAIDLTDYINPETDLERNLASDENSVLQLWPKEGKEDEVQEYFHM